MAGRDATINATLGGQAPETLGANRNANPEVGEAFGIYARNPPPIVLGNAIWNGVLAVRSFIAKANPHLLWGEHWAGVVAKAGSDYVTLENYNRNVGDTDLVEEKAESEFKALRNTGGINAYVANTQIYANAGENKLQRLARLGRNYMKYAVQIGAVAGFYQSQYDRWYFQMYGSGAKSFHEQWKDAVPNSVTFKTRGTDAQLQVLLVSKLNSLLPADPYQAAAAVTLAAHVVNVNAAVGRANITAAFVAGERAVCLARLAAANAYEAGQPHNAVTLGNAYNHAIVQVTAAGGDDVNVQCLAGIAAMQAA